jgi:hypothetical protein
MLGLPRRGKLGGVSEKTIQLDLDDTGLAVDLPEPSHSADLVQDVPYRPVAFRDNELADALQRASDWLRQTQDWLGEPVDVIAIHLDYDERKGQPYYDLKLLCNDEDLAGAPILLRSNKESDG